MEERLWLIFCTVPPCSLPRLSRLPDMGPGLTTGLTPFSIVDLLLLWTPIPSEWRGSVALPRVEPVERPPRHHRPLDPLPQVCPLSVSASNNVKISSRLFKEVISEINIRLPREPTEEFSAGMAILNLLARSTTQMFGYLSNFAIRF